MKQTETPDRDSTQLKCRQNRVLFFTDYTKSDSEFTFKGEVIQPANACRYLGAHFNSNLTFANAFRSLYLVTDLIPLNVRFDVLQLYSLIFLSVECDIPSKSLAKNKTYFDET